MDAKYYVYVYIDPRNFEEFYFGKGVGDRKYSHLQDQSDSEKTRRIRAIQKVGLEPIIRVIAKDLSEHDALLVEKTLLWKLGRTLTNRSSGHYAKKFRPKNTMYKKLFGFDYLNSIYYLNVGEGPTRDWDDCRQYGFLSAGQGVRWRNQIESLEVGDIVVAYLASRGYVGVGRVLERATAVADARLADGQLLVSLNLKQPGLFTNSQSPEKSEYAVIVEWLRQVPREGARWQAKSGLFTSQLVRASLENQATTVKFVEREFELDLERELSQSDRLSLTN